MAVLLMIQGSRDAGGVDDEGLLLAASSSAAAVHVGLHARRRSDSWADYDPG